MRVEVLPGTSVGVPAEKMHIGQLGVVLAPDVWRGCHVLRTYSNFVLLEDPGTTWPSSRGAEPRFMVSVLPPGTVLRLEL